MVYKKGRHLTTCSTCRIALSYCILDKNDMCERAKHLIFLEDKILGRQSEMMHYRHVASSKKTEEFRREVILHRLDSAKAEYQKIQKQLTKSINVAKYCQQKGFYNETI